MALDGKSRISRRKNVLRVAKFSHKPTFDCVSRIPRSIEFQLLPVDSIPSKAIQLAEKKMIFVWFGRVGFVCFAVAGLLTTFALDLLTVIRCVNGLMSIGAVSWVRKGDKKEPDEVDKPRATM